MSSKIKKGEKYQDRIKELEAENARLHRELDELLEWRRQEQAVVDEFNRIYKGG